MNTSSRFWLIVLRIAMGWLFFYAGITKVLDPNWSAAGYLKNAATFPDLFAWFLQPNILPFINFINEWGLTLLGVSLILGIGVRISGILGAILMILYYFPVLTFPKVGAHSYIVDEHIIYAITLLFLSAVRAGREFGLDEWLLKFGLGRRIS